MLTLETNPLNGMCSPPLMGSSGVIPLSIVSVIPDIMQVRTRSLDSGNLG
jgi:hypothetical protein